MNAGQLRHRLNVQTKVETRDTRGGVTETWSTAVTRWGSIMPLSMKQQMEADQLDAKVSHRIVMRYFSGLTDQHRLLEGSSRVFHISSIKNVSERDKTSEILAMEQV